MVTVVHGSTLLPSEQSSALEFRGIGEGNICIRGVTTTTGLDRNNIILLSIGEPIVKSVNKMTNIVTIDSDITKIVTNHRQHHRCQ